MRRRFKFENEHPLTPKQPFDKRKAKRVKFVDTKTDGVRGYVSSRGNESAQSPRSDAPKTSEYAYFRKVKNGAVRGHSRSLHKQNGQLNSFETNYLSRGPEVLSVNLRFPFSFERAGPSDHHLFLSPHDSGISEPDLIRMEAPPNKAGKRSPLCFDNATPVGQSPSLLNEASEIAENQCSEKGIFSAKRHRLRQWATQALFSEAEKLHPKGFDWVSALLSRLFPKGNEKDDLLGDADNISKSLTIHEPKNLEKGIHLSHKRNWDKDLPKLCSGRWSEIVPLDRDNFASGFPFPNNAIESYVQDKSMDHYRYSKSRIHSSDSLYDFSFRLPSGRYRSPGSFHFRDLDEFGSIIERAKEEPRGLLLEWEFQWEKDRVDSCNINCDTAKTWPSRLTTSCNVDQLQILDSELGAEGLFSSSLFSNYHKKFDLLPSYGSTAFLTQDFGPNFEDMKRALAGPGHFSLALPSSPKVISLAEDIYCSGNFILSHRDHCLFKNAGWNGKLQGNHCPKCLPAGDFSAEVSPSIFHAWQFPQTEDSLYSLSRLKEAPEELYSPFSKGTFSTNILSSNLQPSLDTLINCPLLLGHFSQDKSDQEPYLNHEDSKLEYKYIL